MLKVTFFYLEEIQKEKVRIEYNQHFLPDDWYQLVYDDAISELEELGFWNIQISFSGFWSQGDGASFTGMINVKDFYENILTDDEREQFVSLKPIMDDLSCFETYRNTNHYVHHKTIGVYYDQDANTNWLTNDQSEDLVELTFVCRDYIQNYSKNLYKKLEKEYEDWTSDETIDLFFSEYDYQLYINDYNEVIISNEIYMKYE